MKNRVITISREFGSGGRTIGKLVGEKLGIPCYDQELIEQLAQESGFSKEYIEQQSEYSPQGGWLGVAFGVRGQESYSNQDYLWLMQKKVIEQLAEKGPCVIVGRCADYILREKADLLKVFIHANMALRAKRITEVYGETDAPGEKRLRDKDKRRAAYYQFYTDIKWGSAQNFHVALDSGVLGIETCAEVIAKLY